MDTNTHMRACAEYTLDKCIHTITKLEIFKNKSGEKINRYDDVCEMCCVVC